MLGGMPTAVRVGMFDPTIRVQASGGMAKRSAAMLALGMAALRLAMAPE